MIMLTQYYQLQNRDHYSLLAFSGDLDAHCVETIRPALLAQIQPQCRFVVIDLHQVAFIDSHGVGLFVSLLKKTQQNGGRLFIAAADGQPASVLRMVGLNNVLVTYCLSKEDAIAQISTLA